MQQNKLGIILVNTGTPEFPTKPAIVEYLRTFLSDRRIVNLPTLLWRPILEGIVLKARPKKTVEIYKSIWTDEGSPYTIFSESLSLKLSKHINADLNFSPGPIEIKMAHRYGRPSIEDAVEHMQDKGIEQLLVLPLYPQQAFAVTYSVKDELDRCMNKLQYRANVHFVCDYYQYPAWVEAVSASIKEHLHADKDQHLIFSYHSIPLKDLRNGDKYEQQAIDSANMIAVKLGLPRTRYSVAFQSRFNDAQRWLDPFLTAAVEDIFKNTAAEILIVCPGFAVDCTETLYDINIAMLKNLQQVCPGAESRIRYIPCLNDSSSHIQALSKIISAELLA